MKCAACGHTHDYLNEDWVVEGQHSDPFISIDLGYSSAGGLDDIDEGEYFPRMVLVACPNCGTVRVG